jgi:hypothetical protein
MSFKPQQFARAMSYLEFRVRIWIDELISVVEIFGFFFFFFFCFASFCGHIFFLLATYYAVI